MLITLNRSRALAAVTAAGLALGTQATQANELIDGHLRVNFLLMQGLQSIEADRGAFNPANTDTEFGFHRTRFAIELHMRFNDWLTAFVELAEEPNDFGDTFDIKNDLTWMDIALLRAFDSPLAENNSLTLRLGTPVFTTRNYIGFQDGANVQNNPLIGNSPFDNITAEVGAKLLGQHQIGGAVESFGWDVMVSQPDFGEDFSADRSLNLAARLRMQFANKLSVGAGWLRVDSGDQFAPDGDGRARFDSFSSSMLPMGDGDNYNFPGSGTGARDTHAGLLPGIEMDFWTVDFEYNNDELPMPVLVRGWYGEGEDDFSFVDDDGNQTTFRAGAIENVERSKSEIRGWGLEGTLYVMPQFYVATRYTRAENASSGVSGSPRLDRIQVGGGLWLGERTLLKAEYVRQREEENSPGQIGDDWDGYAVEISTRF